MVAVAVVVSVVMLVVMIVVALPALGGIAVFVCLDVFHHPYFAMAVSSMLILHGFHTERILDYTTNTTDDVDNHGDNLYEALTRLAEARLAQNSLSV